MEDLIMNTLSPLMEALVAVMIPIILGFAAMYLKKKTGIDLKQSQLEFLETAAIRAVMQVEGRAMRYLKDKGTTLVGKSKHMDAINKLLTMAPDLTPEEAKQYIDMAVARVPGIGPKDLAAREG